MEEIITRVKAKEKESKLRPEKSLRHISESFFHLRMRDTLATEVKSPSKPKQARGIILQNRCESTSNILLRMSISLFMLLHKSNKLKLPEAQRPDKVEKTNNPKYYLYHRMLGHPTKSLKSPRGG